MPIHTLTLQKQTAIARDTVLFEFEKPAGFTFIPGQYGGFTLPNTDLEVTNRTRRFSFASIPHDPHLSIVTRMQPSPYKQALLALPIGSTIKCAGPAGTFTLHEDAQTPTVFLAGGIGIAPFYSMLRAALHTHPHRHFHLFYCNPTQADSAFFDELHTFAQNHLHFHFLPTMSKTCGFITQDLIKQHLADLTSPIYYICGSKTMVSASQSFLAEMGINEERVKVEDFPGY